MKTQLNYLVAVLSVLAVSVVAFAEDTSAPAPAPAQPADTAVHHDAAHAKKTKRKEAAHRRKHRDVLRGRSSDH